MLDIISAYIDGEISEDEARALEEHMQTCEACLKTLEDFKRLKSNLQTLGDEEVPAEVVSNAAQITKPKIRHFSRWVYTAACIVLVLTLWRGAGTHSETFVIPQTMQDDSLYSGRVLLGDELQPNLQMRIADTAAGGEIVPMAASERLEAIETAETHPEYTMENYAPRRVWQYEDYEIAPEPVIQPYGWDYGDVAVNVAARNKVTNIAFEIEVQSFEHLQSVLGFAEMLSTNVHEAANGRGGRLNYRISYDDYYVLMERLGVIGEISGIRVSQSVLSAEYEMWQSALYAAQGQLYRLLQLIERTRNVEDLLTLQSAISQTQFEIESYEATLRGLEAEFGSVMLEISFTEGSFSEQPFLMRVRDGFLTSLDFSLTIVVGAAIWFAGVALPLALVLAAVFGGWKFIAMLRKRGGGARAAKK